MSVCEAQRARTPIERLNDASLETGEGKGDEQGVPASRHSGCASSSDTAGSSKIGWQRPMVDKDSLSSRIRGRASELDPNFSSSSSRCRLVAISASEYPSAGASSPA